MVEESQSLRNYQESVSLLSTTFKMEQLFKLATLNHDLYCLREDSATTRYEKFVDELFQCCETERLMAEAPPVPLVKPLESHEINKNMNETVSAILRQTYAKVLFKKRAQRKMADTFEEFSIKNLALATFDLQGSLTF